MFAGAVRSAFDRHSGRQAIDADGRLWTYAEVMARASELAEALEERLAPGAPVGIELRRGAWAYISILATLLSGRPFVPLSWRSGRKRAEEQAASIGLVAAWREGASGGPELVPLGESSFVPPEEPLAYIMFTSGSSGRPKAVGISCRQLEAYLSSAGAILGIREDDRVSQFFELSFDLSVHDMFLTWLHGACLVHVPDEHRLYPPLFVRDTRISIWFSTPSALRRLEEPPFPPLSGLRESIFCGEPLFVSQARKWREHAPDSRIWNFYGPTETTIAVSACGWPRGAAGPEARAGVVSIGSPFSGHELALSESGELKVRGPQVCDGYYRAAAHGAFQRDSEGRIWYATGDLATKEGGNFFFIGRADRQVKILGQRVELTEVEEALSSLLGGAHVAAIALPATESASAALYAFVSCEVGDERALFRRIRERLPEAMVPLEIFRISMPYTPHGKTDYAELEAILRERLSPAAGRAGGARS